MAVQDPRNRPLIPRPAAPGVLVNATTSGMSTAHTVNESLTRRRRVACERCRQLKLRCEGSHGAAQPCQRCSKSSSLCIVDAGSKRTRKRTHRASNSLSNPVESLGMATSISHNSIGETPSRVQLSSAAALAVNTNTQLIEAQRPAETWLSCRSDGTATTEVAAATTPESNNGLGHSRDVVNARTFNVATTSRTIGTLTINPRQIQNLFDVYYSYYHPLFPILLLSTTSDAMYETSPLLFWTIISTAARHDSPDFSLLPALIPMVKELLWSTIAVAPHTLPTIQAMSILCTWTFPVPSMPIDITFTLAGTLKAAAMHAGLHRPDVLAHYSRTQLSLTPEQLRQVVKVWCCIYVAIEGVATGNGQQPYIPTDRTIERASAVSNPYELPKSLHEAVAAQVFCTKLHTTMHDIDRLEESASQPRRSSMLKTLESDLRPLEDRLNPQKSHSISIYFLSACFQLQAYWLLDDDNSAIRREGIIKAFDTAVQFIDRLESGENTEYPLRYLVFSMLRVCFTAAVLISKVIHSSYGQYVDSERGRQAFNSSISIFRKCCVEDNDMNGRTTKVLAQLWSIHRRSFETSQVPPRLSLKSRLFFSIAHDALWQWREEHGRQPDNGAPSLPPPLMSPVSATSSRGLSPFNGLPTSSQPMRTVPESHSNTGHIADAGSDWPGSTNQPAILPSEYIAQSNADFAQESLTSALGQNHDGHLAPFSQDCDMLFPDIFMGYADHDRMHVER